MLSLFDAIFDITREICHPSLYKTARNYDLLATIVNGLATIISANPLTIEAKLTVTY